MDAAVGSARADSTQIFAYLTIPEDARIGVCAHELGHLLFGFPDLYDTDDTSEGIGNWCLMARRLAGTAAVTSRRTRRRGARRQQGWVTVDERHHERRRCRSPT